MADPHNPCEINLNLNPVNGKQLHCQTFIMAQKEEESGRVGRENLQNFATD